MATTSPKRGEIVNASGHLEQRIDLEKVYANYLLTMPHFFAQPYNLSLPFANGC